MTHITSLPYEIFNHINGFVGEPAGIERVCKEFKEMASLSYSPLLQEYRATPELGRFFNQRRINNNEEAKITVKNIYNNVLGEAYGLNEGREFVRETLRGDPNKLKASRLVAIAESSKSLKKLQNLITVFEKLAEQVPSANAFLNQEDIKQLKMEEKAKAFSAWMMDPSHTGDLSGVEILNLTDCHLSVLPKEIGQLVQLKTLVLTGNQLTKLPKEIGRLTQLNMLFLEHNQLTELPQEFSQLTTLITLHLEHNQLKTLPEELWSFTALNMLFLQNNQLTEISKKIGNLTRLNVLYLHNNQLEKLPEEMDQLTELYMFLCEGNQLTELPREIERKFPLPNKRRRLN